MPFLFDGDGGKCVQVTLAASNHDTSFSPSWLYYIYFEIYVSNECSELIAICFIIVRRLN